MTTTVTAQIQLRKGTAAQWTSVNPVLASGEVGYETDTGKQKIGDGTTAWTSLAYYHDPDLNSTYELAGTVSTHASGSGVHSIAGVTGLQTALDGKSSTSHDHAATYAPIAKGVTNGDSHDHNGGDGGQIAYSALAGLPTLGTAAAQNTGAFEAAGAISTHASGSGVHSIAGVSGLQAALDSKSATSHDHSSVYAPIAKGVTNGDSHDHSGGDGGQIAYSGLSGLPTLGTAAATASTDYATAAHNHSGTYEPANANIQSHISSTSNPHSVTAAQVGADATGTAAGLLSTHESAVNPHPGYLTPVEGDAAYSALSHNHSGIYEPAGSVATHASGSGVHSIAGVTGLQTALDSKSATSHDHAATYAPIAKGVTNGDSHDHVGGDGAQIAYSGLSGLPTLGTAAAQNTGAFEAAGAVSTHAALTTTHGISSFGATLIDDVDAGTARTTLGLGTAATTASTAYATSAQGATADTALQTATLHAATEKTTPVDADELPMVDSAASWILKKLTWANLKATLTGVFAVLAGKSGGQTLIGGTGVTDKLVLQGTSGNGTSTAAALEVKVGNNGVTTALTVSNDARVCVGNNTSSTAKLEVSGDGGGKDVVLFRGSGGYSSFYVSVSESVTLVSEIYNGPNHSAYAVRLSNDTYGRISFGLDSGVPFLGMGPGNTNRDVWLKRASGDLTFLFGTTPVEKARFTSGGNFGVGVNPAAAIHALKTTEQLRLGYDASYYASFTVSSAGNLTLTNTGTTIYTDKVIENTVNGAGIVLKSPDGTRYRLTVANGGTLSIAAA